MHLNALGLGLAVCVLCLGLRTSLAEVSPAAAPAPGAAVLKRLPPTQPASARGALPRGVGHKASTRLALKATAAPHRAATQVPGARPIRPLPPVSVTSPAETTHSLLPSQELRPLPRQELRPLPRTNPIRAGVDPTAIGATNPLR